MAVTTRTGFAPSITQVEARFGGTPAWLKRNDLFQEGDGAVDGRLSALKASAAPGPLAAAGEPVGPLAFAGTGGPSVAIAPVARLGTEILVNTATANSQDTAQITALTNGGFVVTWSDVSLGVGGATGDTTGAAAKAQVFAADGTRVGTEILVNTATAGSQNGGQITALSNGGFVITWQDASAGVGGATGDTSFGAVKAQVFAADGTRVGSELLVNTATANGQIGPQITALPNGGFVVTWTDGSVGNGGATGDTSSNAVKAQVFGADGTRVGSELLVNTATANGQTGPQITALSNGGFVITWQDASAGVGGATGDTSSTAVKAQVFGADGTRVGSELLVNTATANNQNAQQITALSNGGFVVTWTDSSQGVGGATGDSSFLAVKAQVFAADGARVGMELLVNTATNNNQGSQQITALSNGGFVITWADGSNGVGGATGDASISAIKAQLFAADGTRVGSELLVNTATANGQSGAQITALSNGGFVITWQDASLGVGGATGDSSNNAVKAQVFAADGTQVGTELLVNTATANSQSFAQITALPNGGFVVTWQDNSQGVGGATGDTSSPAIKAQVFNVGLDAVEQVALSLKNRGFTVTDPDAGDVLSVTLSVDYGVLNVTAGTSGATVSSGNGTASVVISGTAAQITALLNSDAGSTVTYTADTDTPPATATVTLTANDGAGGTATTTATITIAGTFDAPAATANADTLSGTAGADTIDGLGGDDILSGGAGNDILNGNTGNDTADYSGAASGVLAQLNDTIDATDGDGGFDTLISIENLTGSAFNDLLIGSDDANVLSGGTGRDTLIGLGGHDRLIGGSGAANQMFGGAGDDTYVVSAIGDTLVEAANEGTDLVQTTLGSFRLGAHLENLTYTGSSAFSGTGNGLNNIITGGTGRDTLTGGGGNDTLIGGTGSANTLAGGTGDDTYVLAAVGDSVVEAANEGTDLVQTTLARITLGANVENLTFTDNAAHTGNGNGLNNIITGGTGADTLSGGGGNDTLIGGAGASNQLIGGTGDDTYVVTALDSIVEAANEGTDTVQAIINNFTLRANIENLTFTGTGNFGGTGNASANILTGGDGRDTLRGAGGNDTLNGGAGFDTADFSGLAGQYTIVNLGGGQFRVTDSVGGRDGVDILNGMEQVRFSNGDRIVLSTIPVTMPVPSDKDAGPQVLPGLSDDDFLPLAKGSDLPLVLPGAEDPFADLLPGLDQLSLARGADSPWQMLTLAADGAPDPAHDGVAGALDRSGWNHDTWSF